MAPISGGAGAFSSGWGSSLRLGAQCTALPRFPSYQSGPFNPLQSIALGICVSAGIGVAAWQLNQHRALKAHSGPDKDGDDASLHSLLFASTSLATQGTGSSKTGLIKEPRTGLEFPEQIPGEVEEAELLGTGVRVKNLFGVKKIQVYAFGVYAEPKAVKQLLAPKFGSYSADSLARNKWFYEDLLTTADGGLAVKLIIFYNRLKMGSVRGAFEQSLGERLEKIGSGDESALKKFTALFSDSVALQRGTNIDLKWKKGGDLTVSVDGKSLGSVNSRPLCHALFDLYVGEPPFDRAGKEHIGAGLARVIA